MDVLALYTTNTLHRIVSYCGVREQIALTRVNKALTSLREKYLPSSIIALILPEHYASTERMPFLIAALKTCLGQEGACISRDRSAGVLLALRSLIPVHVILVTGAESDVSKILPKGSIFDMNHTVTNALYEKYIVGKGAPPIHNRVLFALDTRGVLAYDTLVKYRLFTSRIEVAYLKRLGGCEGSVSQSIYEVKQYRSRNPYTLGVQVGSRIENLFETMLWYIWIREYYIRYEPEARCKIQGRCLSRANIQKIGVSGMIKSL